jgi:hypothetical protein
MPAGDYCDDPVRGNEAKAVNLSARFGHEPENTPPRIEPVKKLAWLLASLSVACGHAAIADEFQNVRCGGDIPKALIGQRNSTGPVSAIEKKYSALSLKDLGADEISDRLSSINWLICGSEYIVLVDHGGLIRDAMAFPVHSKSSPGFSGICQLGGKELPDVFVGILDGTKAGDLLPVVTAWKIDEKRAKFVKVSGENMLCARSGIVTADDGG